MTEGGGHGLSFHSNINSIIVFTSFLHETSATIES